VQQFSEKDSIGFPHVCSSHASATATCEQSWPKQGEGKDQASDTHKWPPCTCTSCNPSRKPWPLSDINQ